jgi:hypothetical protein
MRFFVVALALGACIYESGGTGGSGGGGVGGAGGGPGGAGGGSGGTGGGPGGIVQLSWTLHDQRSDMIIPCRSDETVLVSVSGVDTFPCNAMFGQVTGVPPGNYAVMIYLLDRRQMVEASVSTSSLMVTNGMVSDLGTVLFRVPNAIGDLRLTWEVQSGGLPTNCTPGETVEFGLDNGLFDFNCSDDVATLPSVRAGPYTLSSALKLGMMVESLPPARPLTVLPYTQTDGGHVIFPR